MKQYLVGKYKYFGQIETEIRLGTLLKLRGLPLFYQMLLLENVYQKSREVRIGFVQEAFRVFTYNNRVLYGG